MGNLQTVFVKGGPYDGTALRIEKDGPQATSSLWLGRVGNLAGIPIYYDDETDRYYVNWEDGCL